jgi:NitT/TauT family transport system substrate-binding protein
MSHKLDRRSFLQATGAAAGLASAGTMMSVLPAAAGGHLFTIRMQLGWLASNGIMGEVMADHLGYFEEEGLALEIVPGGPNVDGVRVQTTLDQSPPHPR